MRLDKLNKIDKLPVKIEKLAKSHGIGVQKWRHAKFDNI